MSFASIIKPTKDLVEAVKVKTDELPGIPAQVYDNDFLAWPALADGIAVTSHATTWTLGDWTEIIAANAITADFAIIGIVLGYWGTENNYILIEVGEGASASEAMILQIPFQFIYQTSVGGLYVPPVFFSPRKVTANTRVSARSASDEGSRNTRVKLITVEL